MESNFSEIFKPIMKSVSWTAFDDIIAQKYAYVCFLALLHEIGSRRNG